jgi:hypothetical protein
MANRGLARGVYGRSIKLAHEQVCGVVLVRSEELIPVPFEDPFSEFWSLVYISERVSTRYQMENLT